MMYGWLRSQALRPFYDADAGTAAGAGAGDGVSTSSGAGQASTSQTQAQAASGSAESTDLEVLRRELAEARREAAKYRTERKTADENALKEAGQFKTLYEQAQARIAEFEATTAKAERESLLRKVAKDAGLSEDLIDRLRGESEAELLVDAKALAKRLTPTPPSTGSTNPGARRGDPSEDEQIEAMFSGKGKPKSGMKW